MGTAQPFFQWSYVSGQWGQISSDLLQHISLSLLALAIGLCLSLPLALLAWRYRVLRPPVFGFASALYIIPSLALFAILGPITGYVASYPTAEIALVGYTLLILIWNTVAGSRRRARRRQRGGDRHGLLAARRAWSGSTCPWRCPTCSPGSGSPPPRSSASSP